MCTHLFSNDLGLFPAAESLQGRGKINNIRAPVLEPMASWKMGLRIEKLKARTISARAAGIEDGVGVLLFPSIPRPLGQELSGDGVAGGDRVGTDYFQ